jgi:hypothetical protein
MRVTILTVAVSLLLVFSACSNRQSTNAPKGPGCSLPQFGSLDTKLIPQETGQWCWAASGQMIMGFLNHDVSQCLQANNEFGRSDCCVDKTPEDCVQGGWPEFTKYDFNHDRTSDQALTWDQLREQIACRKTPVAFSWHWTDGTGHMKVIYGYDSRVGVNNLLVNDPLPAKPGLGERQTMTYEEYVSGSDHTHWDDFYNIAHK